MLFLAGEEVSEETKLRCQKCNYEVQVPKGAASQNARNAGMIFLRAANQVVMEMETARAEELVL